MTRSSGTTVRRTVPGSSNGSTWISLAGYGVFLVLLFLSSLSIAGRKYPNWSDPYANLDDSWAAVLEYATLNRMQFGTDLVFPFGPFGHFNTIVGTGIFPGERIAVALLWSLAVGIAALGIARRLEGGHRVLFAAYMVFFPIPDTGNFDAYVYIVIGYCAMLFVGPGDARSPVRYGFLGILSFLSLVKANFLVSSALVLGVSCAVLVVRSRFREAVSVALVYPCTVILLWMVAGQRLTNLPLWIRTVFEISSGYNGAMAVPPKIRVVLPAVAAIAMFLAGLVRSSGNPFGSPARIGMGPVLIVLLFLTWKHGFTRADQFHTVPFLVNLPLLSFLWIASAAEPVEHREKNRLFRSQLGLMLLCLAAAAIQPHSLLRKSLPNWTFRIERSIEDLVWAGQGNFAGIFQGGSEIPRDGETDLPETRKLIGDRPVDVFNYRQWVAISNRLNYRPRPIFQGYSAYTPDLALRNENHFLGESSPEYVLFRMETIDNRFPTLDDSAALNLVLGNYTLISEEKGFLLLHRDALPRKIPYEKIQEKEISFGETIDLPSPEGRSLFLSVRMKPTLWGRTVQTAFQQLPLFIHVETDLEKRRFRFIPDMGRIPFLVSPLHAKNEDVRNFMAGTQNIPVRRVWFEKPFYLVGQMSHTVTVTIWRASGFR